MEIQNFYGSQEELIEIIQNCGASANEKYTTIEFMQLLRNFISLLSEKASEISKSEVQGEYHAIKNLAFSLIYKKDLLFDGKNRKWRAMKDIEKALFVIQTYYGVCEKSSWIDPIQHGITMTPGEAFAWLHRVPRIILCVDATFNHIVQKLDEAMFKTDFSPEMSNRIILAFLKIISDKINGVDPPRDIYDTNIDNWPIGVTIQQNHLAGNTTINAHGFLFNKNSKKEIVRDNAFSMPEPIEVVSYIPDFKSNFSDNSIVLYNFLTEDSPLARIRGKHRGFNETLTLMAKLFAIEKRKDQGELFLFKFENSEEGDTLLLSERFFEIINEDALKKQIKKTVKVLGLLNKNLTPEKAYEILTLVNTLPRLKRIESPIECLQVIRGLAIQATLLKIQGKLDHVLLAQLPQKFMEWITKLSKLEPYVDLSQNTEYADLLDLSRKKDGFMAKERAIKTATIKIDETFGGMNSVMVNGLGACGRAEEWGGWLKIIEKLGKNILDASEKNLFEGQPAMINIGLNADVANQVFQNMEKAGIKTLIEGRRCIRRYKLGNIIVHLFEDTPEGRDKLLQQIKDTTEIPEEKRLERTITFTFKAPKEQRNTELEQNTYVVYLDGKQNETTTPIDACALTGIEYLNYTFLSSKVVEKKIALYADKINESAERFAHGLAAMAGSSILDKDFLDKIAPLSEKGLRQLLTSGMILVKIRPINVNEIQELYKASAAILRSL